MGKKDFHFYLVDMACYNIKLYPFIKNTFDPKAIFLILTWELAGLKATVGRRTMSDQNQKLSYKTKITPDILSDSENSGQNYISRLCFCPTINWRCPTKLLILSNKYVSNKPFLINKLQYPKSSFLQKHVYRKILSKDIQL